MMMKRMTHRKKVSLSNNNLIISFFDITSSCCVGVAYLYLIFGILCFVALMFIQWFVPETKGKSHEDFLEADSSHDDKINMSKPLLTDFE